MKHKWHKEIKAWADGAEIETRFLYAQVEQTWRITNAPRFEDAQWEFRIKPQPKEPQYLYVYKQARYPDGSGTTKVDISTIKLDIDSYIGKIKLED